MRSGRVVYVSFNYRLGALGYLDFTRYSSGLRPFESNLGLRDQVALLGWVRDEHRRASAGMPSASRCSASRRAATRSRRSWRRRPRAGSSSGAIAQSPPPDAVYPPELTARWAAEYIAILRDVMRERASESREARSGESGCRGTASRDERRRRSAELGHCCDARCRCRVPCRCCRQACRCRRNTRRRDPTRRREARRRLDGSRRRDTRRRCPARRRRASRPTPHARPRPRRATADRSERRRPRRGIASSSRSARPTRIPERSASRRWSTATSCPSGRSSPSATAARTACRSSSARTIGRARSSAVASTSCRGARSASTTCSPGHPATSRRAMRAAYPDLPARRSAARLRRRLRLLVSEHARGRHLLAPRAGLVVPVRLRAAPAQARRSRRDARRRDVRALRPHRRARGPRLHVAGRRRAVRGSGRADAAALAALRGDRGSGPAWPRYDERTRSTLVIDATDRVESDPRSERRRAWDAFAPSLGG